MKNRKGRFYEWATTRFPRLKIKWRDRMAARARIFPSILSVEMTNRCNASCIMCPRTRMTRNQGIITNQIYEKILGEASQFQRHLHLFQPFLFGEALLHPEFERLIRLTREKLHRTKIYISTNGALLNESKAKAILESRVDKLNVDIDGLSKPVAEKIRRHVNFDRVKENVRGFLTLRSRISGNTRLRISIIRMPENRHEVEEFTNYWKNFADHVQVVDMNSWLGAVPANDPSGKPISSGDSLPRDPSRFDFPCRHPYEELAIGWDGRATLCCLDYDFEHPVGDVTRNSIVEIWRSEAIERARQKLEAGDYNSLPICKRCNASKFQQNNLWRHLWISGKADANQIATGS